RRAVSGLSWTERPIGGRWPTARSSCLSGHRALPRHVSAGVWEPRHYVRDLVSGNVGIREFVRTVTIATCNALQRRRRGGTYPRVPIGSQRRAPSSLRRDAA